MYIYRALNQLDEKMNPIGNGLIAKSVIDEIIYDDFDRLVCLWRCSHEIPSNISSKELNSIYKKLRSGLIYNFNIPQIINEANKNQEKLNNILIRMLAIDKNAKKEFLDIISTKNAHISNGTSLDYFWISFSKKLEKIKAYYEEQEINKVAVVDSNINGIIDRCNNDKLIAFDLSSRDKISENQVFMINLDMTYTNINYRAYNYSISDEEIIYYNRVPKEKIVTILKPLQYELLLNGLLTEEYYKLPSVRQSLFEQMMLVEMKKEFENDCDIINCILEKYYNNCIPLKKISEESKYKLSELNEANQKILQKVKESKLLKSKLILQK